MTGDFVTLAPDFDWRAWLNRWEQVQNRYNPGRRERLELVATAVRRVRPDARRMLDLGCGTGSLTVVLLETFPDAQVFGIDLDPIMLALAERRLEAYGPRVTLIRTDLRDAYWTDPLPRRLNAVVSATALHWLSAEQLTRCYRRIAEFLVPGGVFLNADHVACGIEPIQRLWQAQRLAHLKSPAYANADDWHGFWNALSQAVGQDLAAIRQAV